MAKLNGMFFLTYAVLGTLVLGIGFLLAGHGEIIFGKKLTADEIALGEKLLRIMTVNAAKRWWPWAVRSSTPLL